MLTVDRRQRWQWSEVASWLAGKPTERAVEEPPPVRESAEPLTLGDEHYVDPATFALAAAQPNLWPLAVALQRDGALIRWARSAELPILVMNRLYQIQALEPLSDDARLMLVLQLLNPELPLIYGGDIVTPSWLARDPALGYALISGPAPEFLADLEQGHWLALLRAREEKVREKSARLEVAMDEERLRQYLLVTSHAQLLAQWEAQRRLFPETQHEGLKLLIDRRVLNEEELIVLLGADIAQFEAAEGILVQASLLARELGIDTFSREEAREWIAQPSQVLYRQLSERINGFHRSPFDEVNRWADTFTLERRLPLARTLVMLAIAPNEWQAPETQRYVNQALTFFSRKIRASTMRGSLVRMSVTSHSARIDITELDGSPSASRLVNHVLSRQRGALSIDDAVFRATAGIESRLRTLVSQTQMYQRDTGIGTLYLGFPFVLTNLQPGKIKPRIAPLLLWPVSVVMAVGESGATSLRFDAERGVASTKPGARECGESGSRQAVAGGDG